MVRNVSGRVGREWLGCVLASLSIACSTSNMNVGGGAGTASTAPQAMAAPSGMSPGGAPAPIAGAGSGMQTQTGKAGTSAPAGSGGQTASSTPSAGSSAAGTSAAGSGGMTGAAAGTGDGDGSGGAGGSAAGSGGGSAPAMDLGKGDGSDVITIGDSWMQIVTNGGGIEGALDRAGTMYRHYAIPGTTLENGGDIPAQYERAKAANPKIATVIMTGGGNDIMFSNGCVTKESCTAAVQMIADALNTLWTEMAKDGVTHVVYIAYSKNAGTAPSDTRPDSAPIPMICTMGSTITCHSLDTTPMVGPGDTVDGIHPTLPACDKIAAAVLDLLEKAGARR